jgi:putative flippase GtrA
MVNNKKNLLDFTFSKFLIIGVINTALGYLIGILIFYTLKEIYSLHFIIIISNIICMLISYINHKIFVFKTRGNWAVEYLKAVIVYISLAILSGGTLWLLVKIFKIEFWIAQLISIILAATISYFGNSKFTFRVNK